MDLDLCPDCGDYIGEGCICYPLTPLPTNPTYAHADELKRQRIAREVEKMGLAVLHFPSNGLLALEIGSLLSEPVSIKELLDSAPHLW